MYVPRASMVNTHMLVSRELLCPSGLFSGGDRDGLGGGSVVMVTGSLGFGELASSGSLAGNVGVSSSAGAEAAAGTTVRLRISDSEALGNKQGDEELIK